MKVLREIHGQSPHPTKLENGLITFCKFHLCNSLPPNENTKPFHGFIIIIHIFCKLPRVILLPPNQPNPSIQNPWIFHIKYFNVQEPSKRSQLTEPYQSRFKISINSLPSFETFWQFFHQANFEISKFLVIVHQVYFSKFKISYISFKTFSIAVNTRRGVPIVRSGTDQ